MSDRVLQSLDKTTKGEMADHAWLKKEVNAEDIYHNRILIIMRLNYKTCFLFQIGIVEEKLKALRQETDAMELRNLQLMETVQRQQLEELEATR